MFDMDDPEPRAGARPVARVADLALDERRHLRLFRLWLSGRAAQETARRELVAALGEARAGAVLGAFEAWLAATAEGARRPLCRHAARCPCVGRDEALLAGMVSAAGRGDAETARALAEEVATPDRALALIHHARALGLALRAAPAPRPTLH